MTVFASSTKKSIKAIISDRQLIINGQAKRPYSMIILMIEPLISLKLYAYKNPPEYSYFILSRNIPEEKHMGIFVFSDRFDIFNFRSQFKQGLAVYLEVLDKSQGLSKTSFRSVKWLSETIPSPALSK
ncbi:MAG: hypothetical protein K2H86_02190, partial [Muribaculaceae bacterium]|nr:hypothetical protein [Muribaculaceae bacterium]